MDQDGEVWVRGPWITSGYYEDAEADEGKFDGEGFFRTGDVASISRDGYMRICDRSKDVIKTGGEWISSIDLENAAVGHPLVAEAAVIGVQSEKWAERPLLVIVPPVALQVTVPRAPLTVNWWVAPGASVTAWGESLSDAAFNGRSAADCSSTRIVTTRLPRPNDFTWRHTRTPEPTKRIRVFSRGAGSITGYCGLSELKRSSQGQDQLEGWNSCRMQVGSSEGYPRPDYSLVGQRRI